MAIYAEDNLFFINSKGFSLILENYHEYLMVRHIGKKVQTYQHSNLLIDKDHSFSPAPFADNRNFSLDTQRQILGQHGLGDFRVPSIIIANDENQLSDFKFKDYTIFQGLPEEKTLPFPYDNSHTTQTIVFTLEDSILDLTLEIYFSIYEESSTISTHRKLINHSSNQYKIKKIDSFTIDLQPLDYQFITFQGAYGREKEMVIDSLKQGTHSISSTRGASGHSQSPSLIIGENKVNESYGECIAVQLMYSGNFHVTVQKNQLREIRVSTGIEPTLFEWRLDSNTDFVTPAVVINFSDAGLNQLTHISHDYILNHIMPHKFANQIRPILLNNWEATYFDFSYDKLINLAKVAKDVGIELFVLDDGWFGNRFDDNRALGDWFVNEEKLSGGLEQLITEIHNLGMQFGIWFEPEMISENSELYQAHPDWVIRAKDRNHIYSRNQLVLDLSNPEVVNFIKETLSHFLTAYDIDYVKWDMNRNITNVGNHFTLSENLMQSHKYMLGLYEILDYLTQKHPNVLFESCAGGGGRNDLGIMRYFPQVWTSDNTDAISRIQLQKDMTYLYPTIAMGAHVSAVPNHQTGRITPLETRNHIAMMGNLGYELDLTTMSADELLKIKQCIATYKTIRSTVQLGQLTRLETTHPTNEYANQFVSDEMVVLTYVKILSDVEFSESVIKLKDLDEKAYYVDQSNRVYSGEELTVIGITMPVNQQDFYSNQIIFNKIKEN
ncbi:alpha-galactosidase [Fundicoccus culcitae]|uniref:Alpha-galactosidase n=1 Tax=Fundicoccus culcitae TaxID=2969821 RepID=A0ABY5P9S1_9LACT|nr:alpha-galactosidase [Fundicoccus culcitae]UUX35098.1 alpha-galactosidase [Fundicoccus culcitae]